MCLSRVLDCLNFHWRHCSSLLVNRSEILSEMCVEWKRVTAELTIKWVRRQRRRRRHYNVKRKKSQTLITVIVHSTSDHISGDFELRSFFFNWNTQYTLHRIRKLEKNRYENHTRSHITYCPKFMSNCHFIWSISMILLSLFGIYFEN